MPQRRLTAILSADVVGYSRLMGEDESGTLAALKAHRNELFDPEITRRGGRIAKLMGDGVLVEFPSVVDAVEAAVTVQRALKELGGLIQLRMGINLGDVIVDGDEIYGDGVNVAARLESIAEPGSICVSAIVHESIRNRVDATFADNGEIELKNIDHPVHVFQWSPDQAATHGGKPAFRRSKPARSSRALVAATVVGLVLGIGGAFVGLQFMREPPATKPDIIKDVIVPGNKSIEANAETAAPIKTTAAATQVAAVPTTPAPAATDVAAPDVAATPEPSSTETEVAVTEAVPEEKAPEASTEAEPVPGGELAEMLGGKTIRGGNEFGGKRFTLRLAASGTFQGEVSFDDTFGSGGVDSGRWRVRGDELCVSFDTFAAGRQICSTVMRTGEAVTFETANGVDRNWSLGAE